MKKVLSVLLIFMLTMYMGSSVNAVEPRGTNYVTKRTSGGPNGYVNVEFRCTCIQDTRPGYFTYGSSITPPSNLNGFNYNQEVVITMQNHTQKNYKVQARSFSKTFNNALVGGSSSMWVGSAAFGSASETLYVTR